MNNIYFDFERENILPIVKEEIKTAPKDTTVIISHQTNSSTNFNITTIKQLIDNILDINNNVKIQVVHTLNEKYIADSKECKELEKIDNYLRENYNTELFIKDKNSSYASFGFRKTLLANRKLDKVANKIKNTKYSNFEKFMLAYEFVTEYMYKDEKNTVVDTRYWIPVIDGDKIVCAGYASLLEALCDRIFDPNEVKVVQQGLSVKDKDDFIVDRGGHANNLVFMKDDKYDINGVFYTDACWDCKKDSKDDIKPLSYCCIPLKDLLSHKRTEFSFDGLSDFYLRGFKEYRDMDSKKTYSLEKSVHDFFKRHNNSSQKEYYQERFKDSTESLQIDTYSNTRKEIEQLKKETKEKYSSLLDSYENLNDIVINYKTIQKLGLIDYIEPIEQGNLTNNELKEHIDKMWTILKQNQEEITDSNDYMATDFKKYILSVLSRKKEIEITQKYEEITLKECPTTKANIESIKKNFLPLANTEPIPIEAFINSFKIIGKHKGLWGGKLKKYTKERIKHSVLRTKENFDEEKCSNCFANVDINLIEKGVITLK